MTELCDWVDANRPGRSFLTMDNLNLHRHPIVSNLIYGRGHRVVFCAPYWSCDGSIEYIFNTVQTRLQMDVHGVDTVFDLVNKINTIVGHKWYYPDVLSRETLRLQGTIGSRHSAHAGESGLSPNTTNII